MHKKQHIAGSAIIIIILGIAGKLFSFVREMLIGAKFGSGYETDTYLIALSSIALFTGLITRAINTTAIPVLAEVEKNEGKAGKIEHTNNLLNIILLFAAIISVLAYFSAPYVLKIVAPGFESKAQLELAILLMRIGIPTILFSGMQGVFRGFLQTEGNFIETAAATFPMNFIYIAFLLFYANSLGIQGLMAASVLAVVSQVLLQVYGLKKIGYSYKLVLDFKDKYIVKILRLIPPVLLSVGISDINSVIDKAMASGLVEGSISALNYAGKLMSATTGIFVSAITTVLYPTFSQEANKATHTGLKRVVIRGINVIMLITLPATVGLIVLAQPIVKIVYERGRFDAMATYMTAGALVFTVLRLTTTSIRTLLYRTFYSLQDTKTPVLIGFLAVATNILFNFILIKPMAHRGLALATTISSIVSTIIAVYLLRKKIGSFGFMSSVISGVKTLGASVIMGVIALFTHRFLASTLGVGTMNELIALVGAVGIGAVVYFALIYLFKVDEVNWVLGMVKRRLGR